jgi:hypothetical protein
MVINDFNVKGMSVFPAEAHPPLIINTDAVLPSSITFEQFQPIVRRNSQVIYTARPIKLSKFALRDAFNIDESCCAFALEQRLRIWTLKRPNHHSMITSSVNNAKRYF